MSDDTKDIGTLLENLFYERSDGIRSQYDRILPFGDVIVDRWEKAKFLGFGAGTSVYDSSLVLGEVTVGDQVWIGPQTVLDGGAAKLTIGSYCSISAGVQIYTHDSVGWAVTGGKQKYSFAPVSIGSCVYIGPQTIISKGVTIGNHCIIGACSLVNTSFPDFSVIWGQPATLVGTISLSNDGSAFSIEYR